jgi:membrane-bound lytic murein transglycosylase B
MILRPLAACLLALTLSTPALAAQCGGDFQTFVASISREAQGQGVSQAVISQALGGVTQDQAVLAFDRRQRRTFNKTFEQYVATRVGPARIKRARAMMQRHASILSRVEQRFGVPREILVAIWTLETDNGSDMGKHSVFRVLATMAHDCRRTELFQRELLPARSARRNSCRRPTSSTASTSTATATSISAAAFLMCSPPPPTC